MRGDVHAKPVSVNGTDYPSTAAAIRELHAAGYTRAEIARATGAQVYFVNSTLTGAVRAWPADKCGRIKDLLLHSVTTIAETTGTHEEDVIAFAIEALTKTRRERIKASATPVALPPEEPAAAPEPLPIVIKDEEPVKQLPPAPKKLDAALARPRPPVRAVAPRAGIDPAKLFNLRDPETGEWLHQTIIDVDEVTLTTTGKAYRYEQTVATIQRLKAKWPRFAHWKLDPIVKAF